MSVYKIEVVHNAAILIVIFCIVYLSAKISTYIL